MNIRGFIRKALSWHHFPMVELAAAFHHINKGLLQMTEVAIIPGAQQTVNVVGIDSFGQEIPLTTTVTGVIDNTAVATVTDGTATNTLVVTGVTVGTANLTIASGSLSLVVPVVVSADTPVSLAITLDAPVLPAATEAPAVTEAPAAA